jgi:hypothetical protein
MERTVRSNMTHAMCLALNAWRSYGCSASPCVEPLGGWEKGGGVQETVLFEGGSEYGHAGGRIRVVGDRGGEEGGWSGESKGRGLVRRAAYDWGEQQVYVERSITHRYSDPRAIIPMKSGTINSFLLLHVLTVLMPAFDCHETEASPIAGYFRMCLSLAIRASYGTAQAAFTPQFTPSRSRGTPIFRPPRVQDSLLHLDAFRQQLRQHLCLAAASITFSSMQCHVCCCYLEQWPNLCPFSFLQTLAGCIHSCQRFLAFSGYEPTNLPTSQLTNPACPPSHQLPPQPPPSTPTPT